MKFDSADQPNDVLGEALRSLREDAFPQGPPPPCIEAAERIAFTHTPSRRPWIVRSAIAAALILGVSIAACVLLQHSATIAFADVVQSVNRTNSFTATIEASVGGSAPLEGRLFGRGTQLRVDIAGTVLIADVSKGQVLTVIQLTRQAKLQTAPMPSFDLYTALKEVHPGEAKPVGERMIDHQRLLGFRAIPQLMPGGERETWTFWVDPQSKLPVQVEVGPVVLRNLRFDTPLNDDLFSLDIPKGYSAFTAPAVQMRRYAGRVVDERGNPLVGVNVHASDRYTAYSSRAGGGDGDVPLIKTDSDGRFAIDRPHQDRNPRLGSAIVRLEFQRLDLPYASLGDVDLLSPVQRANLQITLPDGTHLAGRVVDTAGRPVAGVHVEAIYGWAKDDLATRSEFTKTAVTDAAGSFTFRGLAYGPVVISAFKTDAAKGILCAHVGVDLVDDPTKPVELSIEPFRLPEGTIVRNVLGMKLIDVSKAVKEQLMIVEPAGVLVLDPGPESHRLMSGQFSVGDVIWMIGDTRISSVDELTTQLRSSVKLQRRWHVANPGVQIVFDMSPDEGEGSSTNFLTLGDDDIAAIEKTTATSRP